MKSDNVEKSLQMASVDDLVNGFGRDAAGQNLVCLFCGERFEEGVVYPVESLLLSSRRAAEHHVSREHGGAFTALIGLGGGRTGLSEIQETVMKQSFDGRTDREIAAALGGKSESTVRNHRFQMRRRRNEAKIYLALMELLEKSGSNEPRFIEFSADLPVKDERMMVTVDENAAILRKHVAQEGKKLRLISFPKKQKAKLVVLNRLAELFERGRQYTEAEVNQLLTDAGDESGEIRRYLIDYGFLSRKRDGSAYWRV